MPLKDTAASVLSIAWKVIFAQPNPCVMGSRASVMAKSLLQAEKGKGKASKSGGEYVTRIIRRKQKGMCPP